MDERPTSRAPRRPIDGVARPAGALDLRPKAAPAPIRPTPAPTPTVQPMAPAPTQKPARAPKPAGRGKRVLKVFIAILLIIAALAGLAALYLTYYKA